MQQLEEIFEFVIIQRDPFVTRMLHIIQFSELFQLYKLNVDPIVLCNSL